MKGIMDRALYERRYGRTNAFVAKARAHRSRCMRLHIPGEWSALDWQRMLADFNASCAYCSTRDALLSPDHIYPLHGPLDGNEHLRGNTPLHIVPACTACNTRKDVMDPVEWIGRCGATVNPIVFRRLELIRQWSQDLGRV